VRHPAVGCAQPLLRAEKRVDARQRRRRVPSPNVARAGLSVVQRTLGRKRPRARGRRGGRPKALQTKNKVAMAQLLYDDKRNSIAEICKTLKVSKATLYRYIKAGARHEQSLGLAA
jgi:hypothetical protein